MANLKDIADKLQVSVSTVSRALNNSDEISEEVKEKVQKTAKELGYTLRGRGGKSTPEWNAIGIIVPEVLSEHYAKIVHISKKLLAAKGYSAVIKVSDYNASETVEAIHAMARIRVKGLLIALDENEVGSEQIVRALRLAGLPVLLITNSYHPLLDYDCIHLDEYAGFLLGLRHLLEQGARRIAFLGDTTTPTRVQFFRQAMEFLGQPVHPELICLGEERNETGGDLRMRQLLALEPQKQPDAVFCSCDQMAVGAISALREAGIRVPKAMKIIGFDDCSASRFVEGGITTIVSPYEDMLAVAVRILTQREQNRHSSLQQVAIRPELIVRATT